MSKTSKIILVTIIATLILLGLGYAAIQNITLNITGNVAAQVNAENFKVRFVGTPTVSDGIYATAKIENDTNASITVSDLTSKGQYVTASYDIKNESGDLSADLNILATTTNMEYFTITSKLGKQSLSAGETTNVLVTVELIKTPISGPVNTDIDIELTAIPVQPGEEGKTEGITDFSQTMTGMTGYGFFAGQVYSGINNAGELQSVIFYEDGSMEYYRDGKFVDLYPAGTAVYSEDVIDVSNFTGTEDSIVTVSDDGLTIDFLGMTGSLDEDFFDVYGLEEGTYYGRSINGNMTWLRTMAYEVYQMDYYLEGDYTYFAFSEDAWSATVSPILKPLVYPEGYTIVSTEKTSYGEILSYVNGKPLTSISYMFRNCPNLTVAPEIPETVEAMAFTFSNCSKLVTAPVIPSSVTNLLATFSDCTGLRGNVVINCTELIQDEDCCFENVDMRYINLTGSAPISILKLLGQTGLNFTQYK